MPPPRPNVANTATPPSEFPPYRPFPIDRLGRIRGAFRAAGWRVLPGYLPRVTMPGWLERRRLDAGAMPTPTSAPTVHDFTGVSGPDPHRCLTLIHPAAPLAVTVERIDVGYGLDFTLWWEGEYASSAASRVPAETRADLYDILTASDPRD